jgi:uncharacterized cupin superfamily protein
MSQPPIAVLAIEVAPRARVTHYPEPFASRVAGREKRALGDLFGLRQLGINLTRLAPGSVSSVRHAHSHQDEFVYILRGRPVLRTDAGSTQLGPGMCAGFRAGTGNAHQLVNESEEPVEYLELGDRGPGDSCTYPDDDLAAHWREGRWVFTHKDGTPY